MRYPYLGLALVVALAACTQKPKVPNLSKYGNGNSRPETGEGPDNTPNANDPKTPEPEPEYPTEIELVNTKFKGEESKLEAVVKYAGDSSAKIKLEGDSSAAKISIPKLAAGKSDALVVEIYEGEKLRFKATRAQTQIEKSKANKFKIEDCAIQKLPWTGEANETLCGWTVQDVKN